MRSRPPAPAHGAAPGPGTAPAPTPILLNDEQVLDFIVRGYHIVEAQHRPGLNETIDEKLNKLDHNPGDGILDAVPELHEVYDHPEVRGALMSLLGHDMRMHSHRHWHSKPPGSGAMSWHQDSTNQRHHQVRLVLGLYYPHEVTADMGPTIVVPGTHLRNAPTDRMATYFSIRGQVPLTVKAGTVAITHYDIWHGTSANRSPRRRHMLKFLFHRVSEPEPGAPGAPSWDHDPQRAEALFASAAGAMPVACSQSDHYKERSLRREMWEHLLGRRTPDVKAG